MAKKLSMIDNGISHDTVDRELAYALATSEILYKINLKKTRTFKYIIIKIAILLMRFLKLENIEKKLLKWNNK